MSGANAVREDRLWQRHADMAKLGGTPKGGVNRQALSAEDAAARNLLAAWAKARGFVDLHRRHRQSLRAPRGQRSRRRRR